MVRSINQTYLAFFGGRKPTWFWLGRDLVIFLTLPWQIVETYLALGRQILET
jgi:hypothetical protein